MVRQACFDENGRVSSVPTKIGESVPEKQAEMILSIEEERKWCAVCECDVVPEGFLDARGIGDRCPICGTEWSEA